MTSFEKRLFKLLLLGDAAAILISMVAGPLEHTVAALSAAACAVAISLCLIFYSLYFWPMKK